MGRHDQMVLDIGEDVDGYRVESFVARGGMAVVYKARDRRLGRPVALKLIAPELASDPTFRARFTRESELAASLDHPNVLPIYQAGEIDGMLWTAMRFVDGEDLDTVLGRRGRLTPAETITIFTAVAAALDAAHARALVHRDVKPGNILLTGHDNADDMNLAARHVYLTDFGLTKRSADVTGLTTAGQFLGTIAYVAPEQIASQAVDHRADVYSLGCVLYHVLAGAPPFARDDYVAMLWAHIQAEPPPLSAVVPGAPPAVDAVLRSAMAKQPAARPDSCGALVGQLRDAFGLTAQAPFRLADQPPGRIAGVYDRFAGESPDDTPTVARNAPPDVGRPGGDAEPVPDLGQALVLRPPPEPPPVRRERPEPSPGGRSGPRPGRPEPDQESPPTLVSHRRDPEPPPRRPARRPALVAGAVVLILLAVGAGFWLLGSGHSGRTPGGSPPSSATAAPGSADAVPASLPRPTVLTTLKVGASPQGVAVSRDGRRVYVANSGERSVSVIDTEDQRPVASVAMRNQPQYLAISPDGKLLYVTTHNDDGGGNTVAVVDIAGRKIRKEIGVDHGQGSSPYAPALSPGGDLLYVPDHGRNVVTVIDTEAGGVLMTLPVARSPHWVVFSPDGDRAYLANHESNLMTVVDATKTSTIATIVVGKSPHSVAVAPDESRAFTANYDVSTASVVDLRERKVIRTVAVGKNPRCVAVSADGRRAYFAATGDDVLTVVDTKTLTKTADVPLGTDPWMVAVSADGRTGYVTNRGANSLSVLSLAE